MEHSETTQALNLKKVTEVADQLGMSRASIYRLIKAGDIKPLKIGKCIRFRPTEVDRFIRELEDAR